MQTYLKVPAFENVLEGEALLGRRRRAGAAAGGRDVVGHAALRPLPGHLAALVDLDRPGRERVVLHATVSSSRPAPDDGHSGGEEAATRGGQLAQQEGSFGSPGLPGPRRAARLSIPRSPRPAPAPARAGRRSASRPPPTAPRRPRRRPWRRGRRIRRVALERAVRRRVGRRQEVHADVLARQVERVGSPVSSSSIARVGLGEHFAAELHADVALARPGGDAVSGRGHAYMVAHTASCHFLSSG